MIYRGQLPLIEQPKLGSKNIERIYRGTQLMYGNPLVSFIEATGGTITYDGDYKIHTFTSDDSFIVTNAPAGETVRLLVVAGGGAGGPDVGTGGGGGGGGGVIQENAVSVSKQTYSITIGAGGTAGTNANPNLATNGGNSVALGYTAIGGGRGGVKDFYDGATGGSGGGGAAYVQYTAGTATSGQGNAGGNGQSGGFGAGGGGGAGAAGSNGASGNGGNGGNGISSNITGTATYYAGGGGGGSENGGSGTGGLGGGGNAGTSPQNGTNGLGGGGGGRRTPPYAQDGTSGGSGVVIIRYKYKQSPWVGDNLFMYIDPATSTVAGTTISDLSGNGRNSTLVGGLGVSAGYFRLNDANYYITSPINFPQAASDEWSVEFWFKAATTGYKSGNPCLFSGYNTTGNEPGLQIQCNNSNQLGFEYRRVGSQVDGNVTDTINDGAWHHWVFTKAAYPNASGVNFYRDTVLKITRASLADTTDPGIATGYMMGRDVDGGDGWTDAYGGLIRFYTKALTAEEIQQNYNANKADYGL